MSRTEFKKSNKLNYYSKKTQTVDE